MVRKWGCLFDVLIISMINYGDMLRDSIVVLPVPKVFLVFEL